MSEDREREDLGRVREERLSDRLGRLQADSGGSDALDWAELGVNVAGLAAAPFTGGASLLAGPAFSAGKKGAKMASPDTPTSADFAPGSYGPSQPPSGYYPRQRRY